MPKHWVEVNPDFNNYNSDPMEISRAFWLPDISDRWRQHEETHSKYGDLSNVARDIFSIIPHCVGVEASFSLGRGIMASGSEKPMARPSSNNSL